MAGSLCFVIDGARWGSWRVERGDTKTGGADLGAMCIDCLARKWKLYTVWLSSKIGLSGP